jgi:hypothetical protein
MPRVLMLLAAMAVVSCANTTTMVIKQNRDGSISVNSGKDVKAERVEFRRGDEEVVVVGYSSMANADVINAQSAREVSLTQAITAAVLQALQAGISAAAKGAGVP